MKKCITLIVVLFFILIDKTYTQHPPPFDEHIAFALKKIRERPVGISEERAHALYLDSEKTDTLVAFDSLKIEKTWIPFTGVWKITNKETIVSFDGNEWGKQISTPPSSKDEMIRLRSIFSVLVLLPLLLLFFSYRLIPFLMATIGMHLIFLIISILVFKNTFYLTMVCWQVSTTICGVCIWVLKNLVQKR